MINLLINQTSILSATKSVHSAIHALVLFYSPIKKFKQKQRLKIFAINLVIQNSKSSFVPNYHIRCPLQACQGHQHLKFRSSFL